jgi:hypothetical protein
MMRAYLAQLAARTSPNNSGATRTKHPAKTEKP